MPQHHIVVTNVTNGDVLTYSLAIIRGAISGSGCTALYITSSDAEVTHTEYPVVDGHFTVLYELKPGANEIRLGLTPEVLGKEAAKKLMLVYEPMSSARPFVRPVYLLAADSDGTFQSPYPCRTCADGVQRLRVACLMVQSALAEMMLAHGFGRRTFALAPEVLIHRMSRFKLSVAHNTADGMLLWRVAEDSLSKLPRRDDSIDLAVMSFSCMVGGKVRAHTALGGGPLALFGGASLWTWPSSVADIAKCFLDERRFHPMQYFDDSGNRKNIKGLVAATTLGALLHELGHCLSLPHPADGKAEGHDVMKRGFDYFDRLFLQCSANCVIPGIGRGAAVRLRWHRYLQFEGEMETRRFQALNLSDTSSPVNEQATPTPVPTPVEDDVNYETSYSFDNDETGPTFERLEDGSIVCHANAGIGHVGYYLNGDNASHEEFLSEKEIIRRFILPCFEDIQKRCDARMNDDIKVSAIDLDGNIIDMPYDDI